MFLLQISILVSVKKTAICTMVLARLDIHSFILFVTIPVFTLDPRSEQAGGPTFRVPEI